MVEARSQVAIGLDIDGVVAKKYSKVNPRNWAKWNLPLFPLHPVDGAAEGIRELQAESDVKLLGAYTIRPRIRRGATQRFFERNYLPPMERIVHTANSYKAKIGALLLDAKNELPDRELSRIVLIDDSVSKVVSGAHALWAARPDLRPLLARFTLVAFNPRQNEKLLGMIFPGIVHVISMQSWQPKQIDKMLDKVRNL